MTLSSHMSSVLALRGLAAIAFGVLAFSMPEMALLTLVVLFGVFALFDGAFAVVGAVVHRNTADHWWFVLLSGLVSIFAGVVVLARPGLGAIALLFFIAAWILARGCIEMAMVLQAGKGFRGARLLFVAGVLSMIVAVVLFSYPVEGVLAILWLISLYAVVFGVMQIIEAFRVRGWLEEAHKAPKQPAGT